MNGSEGMTSTKEITLADVEETMTGNTNSAADILTRLRTILTTVAGSNIDAIPSKDNISTKPSGSINVLSVLNWRLYQTLNDMAMILNSLERKLSVFEEPEKMIPEENYHSQGVRTVTVHPRGHDRY